MSFVQVEGVLTRPHNTGLGFSLKETSQSKDGREFTRYWTAFPKAEHAADLGDKVEVTGFLGAKVSDPKTDSDGNERRYVDLTVNQATVKILEAVRQSNGEQAVERAEQFAAAEDNWAGAGDETPF